MSHRHRALRPFTTTNVEVAAGIIDALNVQFDVVPTGLILGPQLIEDLRGYSKGDGGSRGPRPVRRVVKVHIEDKQRSPVAVHERSPSPKANLHHNPPSVVQKGVASAPIGSQRIPVSHTQHLSTSSRRAHSPGNGRTSPSSRRTHSPPHTQHLPTSSRRTSPSSHRTHSPPHTQRLPTSSRRTHSSGNGRTSPSSRHTHSPPHTQRLPTSSRRTHSPSNNHHSSTGVPKYRTYVSNKHQGIGNTRSPIIRGRSRSTHHVGIAHRRTASKGDDDYPCDDRKRSSYKCDECNEDPCECWRPRPPMLHPPKDCKCKKKPCECFPTIEPPRPPRPPRPSSPPRCDECRQHPCECRASSPRKCDGCRQHPCECRRSPQRPSLEQSCECRKKPCECQPTQSHCSPRPPPMIQYCPRGRSMSPSRRVQNQPRYRPQTIIQNQPRYRPQTIIQNQPRYRPPPMEPHRQIIIQSPSRCVDTIRRPPMEIPRRLNSPSCSPRRQPSHVIRRTSMSPSRRTSVNSSNVMSSDTCPISQPVRLENGMMYQPPQLEPPYETISRGIVRVTNPTVTRVVTPNVAVTRIPKQNTANLLTLLRDDGVVGIYNKGDDTKVVGKGDDDPPEITDKGVGRSYANFCCETTGPSVNIRAIVESERVLITYTFRDGNGDEDIRQTTLDIDFIIAVSERVWLSITNDDDFFDYEERKRLLMGSLVVPVDGWDNPISDDEVFEAYVIWLYSYIGFINATQWGWFPTDWYTFPDLQLGAGSDYLLERQYLLDADLELWRGYNDLSRFWQTWATAAIGGCWWPHMWPADYDADERYTREALRLEAELG